MNNDRIKDVFEDFPLVSSNYLEIANKYGDIDEYVTLYEVCERASGHTLAIWFDRSISTSMLIVSDILEIFNVPNTARDTLVHLMRYTNDSDLIIVNPDILSNTLRYYYRNTEGRVLGKDISFSTGLVTKTKYYSTVKKGIETSHYYLDGGIKTTMAKYCYEIPDNKKYDNKLVRDDDQVYYSYIPKSRKIMSNSHTGV